MRKNRFACVILCLIAVLSAGMFFDRDGYEPKQRAMAQDEVNYYTIYDYDNPKDIVLTKGDGVDVGDEYLSSDNKLWRIVEVDNKTKTGKAEFLKVEQLPKFEVKKKSASVAVAASRKKVGVYHTHNDESYIPSDGYDSVYGKGGVHDVGKAFVKNLEKRNIEVVYKEDLHLPHNSLAYTRSQTTAQAILNTGNISALFDVHRDSTPRKEYATEVDGVEMSKVRMVVGTGNQNYNENKDFAYAIKAYADEVYPNFIKDIYMGKGNYNQQLLSRGMLFEMGCENIEKELAIKSTEPLSKIVDVVLFGSEKASKTSLADVELVDSEGKESVITGIADKNSSSLSILWVLLGAIGFYLLVLGILCIFSKTVRYKTGRFFKELFAIRRK